MKFDIAILPEDEFSELSRSVFASRKFDSDTARENYVAETMQIQKAVRDELGKQWTSPDDFEVGYEWGPYMAYYNCGGIYSERIFGLDYILAILKVISEANHPEITYYNTVSEIILPNGDLEDRGEFYISDKKISIHREMSDEHIAKLTGTR